MKKILLFLCAIFFTTNVFATGVDANDTTAPCDSETLGQTSGTVNVEVNWQPNTINIRWYDGENQLTVQSTAQSCVYDDDLYLPNVQPTKTGYTFKGWTVKYAIPEEYTELEYIESTGTQYIDTGFKFTGNTVKYELVYNLTAANHNRTLFGASDNNVNWSGLEYLYGSNGNPSNGHGFYIGSNAWDFSRSSGIGTTHVYSVFVDRVNGRYETIEDGDVHSASFSGTVTSTVSVALFGHKENDSSVIQRAIYKNYGFKITQDNVPVRNMVPAKRNSDNVVGMYDSVTGTFFTNAGTGTFTAGPAVQ